MSHESENHKPDFGAVSPIEQTLANFVPARPQTDRDRLMFLAGQASVEAGKQEPVVSGQWPVADMVVHRRNGVWLWPASSAVLAATSLALLVALLTRAVPQPQVVYRDRLVTVAPVEAAKQSASRPATYEVSADVRPAVWRPSAIPQNNYVHVRDVALRLGLDALGAAPAVSDRSAPAATYREILESLVPGDQQPAAAAQNQPSM